MSLSTAHAIAHRFATIGLRATIQTVHTELHPHGVPSRIFIGDTPLHKNYDYFTFHANDQGEVIFDIDQAYRGEELELMPLDDWSSDEESEEEDEIRPLSPVVPDEYEETSGHHYHLG